MANNPALLSAWWNFRNHAIYGGNLQQRHRELIVLRVAVHMKSWYEWASHVERGLKAGLSIDEIERVRIGEIDSGWNRSDALILRATDECYYEQKVTLKTRSEMQDLFNATQLMDLIAIYGAYVILGTMINTWGLELDDFLDLPSGIADGSQFQS
jgi:alkylhydroperoxidase family enzyme